MFVKLDLIHQQLIEQAIHRLNYSLSEYSFANLYLFRQIHRYEISLDGPLLIRGLTRKNEVFLMPLFPLTEYSLSDLRSFMTEIFFPMPEETLKFFDSTQFQTSFSDDDNDYLFLLDKLKSYPGRHLSNKRNLVNQFLSNFHPDSALIQENDLEASLEILEIWKNAAKLPADQTDYDSCKEALHLINTLNLTGRIYIVEGKPAAFLLGEYMNDDTFIFRFAKADIHFKGIYQYMYQDFAKRLSSAVKWINMEVDLGINSLHRTKSSYLPDRLIHKYRIRRNTI